MKTKKPKKPIKKIKAAIIKDLEKKNVSKDWIKNHLIITTI